jgi:endo-1,4-beta-xylanase
MKRNSQAIRLLKFSALAVLLGVPGKMDTFAARSAVSQTPNLISANKWKLHTPSEKDGSTLTEKNGILHLWVDQAFADQGLSIPLSMDTRVKVPSSRLSQIANIEIGQALHLRFLAKSATTQGLRVQIIQSKYPYAQTLGENPQIGQTWKEYNYDCIAPASVDRLSLFFKPKCSIDLKDISVTGRALSDLGLAEKDLSQSGIASNIEEFRKARVKIVVVDRQGRRVPKALVHIDQNRQKFLFGTQAQGLNPELQSDIQQKYQKALVETFNFATVTPYWPQVERKPGQVDFQDFDRQIDWLSSHGFAIKIHPLFWPHFTPSFVPSDPDQAKLLADRHTELMAAHFTQFPSVHFLENNEAAAAINDPTSNGVINWVRRVGADKAVEHQTEIERKAGKRNGSAPQIVYNDYLQNDEELGMLEQLERAGQLPDAIGVQMHMSQGFWPLARVQYIINRLARFHKPIYITEISVISGEARIGNDAPAATDVWPSTPDGEEAQAQYVSQLYRLLYSNQNIQGITWWDLSDHNSWQKAPRGLLREDMSRKAAYNCVNDLIRNQWRTQISLPTNEDGEIMQRLFLGQHEVSISNERGERARKTVQLDDAQKDAVTVTLQLE